MSASGVRVEIVVFKSLHKDEIEQMVKLQTKQLQTMLQTQGIELQVSDAAVDWLAAAGYDPMFGARPVKRVIQKNLLNELSKRILSGNVKADRPIKVDDAMDQLKFEN